MREIIAVENCKSNAKIESAYCKSLTRCEIVRVPMSVVTLTITLLILTLAGESAYGQYPGFYLYDRDTSETTVRAKAIETGNREYTQDYFKPEEPTGANQLLLIPDPHDLSIGRSPGILPSERIQVSQGLSDKFAINDMYSTESRSGNSDTSVYASNDAEANSNTPTPKSKDWEFILIPYGWFTSISEDIVVNGRGASAHASFFDLLKHLDIAGMFHGAVWWKGKFGIYADTLFSKLTINQDVTLTRFGSINANVQTTMFIQEFGGLYRVGTWPVGSPYNQFVQKSKPTLTFNILAGGRYWHLKNEIDIKTPFGILPSETDQSQNWFDFIVGGGARLEFYKKLFLDVRTDIGGFDLSFSSKFSWNILAVVGYELPWYRITPLIGYRALYDNYTNGSGNSRFDAKTWMYGPVLGVAFKF
jgi:hypothetical protein